MTNDWVVMYEGYKIHFEAQGNDSFIVDMAKIQYCLPSSWNGSTCSSYSTANNGGDNTSGWCLSTDHSAAEVTEQNGAAFQAKCCDGAETVLTGVGSSPSFSFGAYYGC
jgi:hypothetical protein